PPRPGSPVSRRPIRGLPLPRGDAGGPLPVLGGRFPAPRVRALVIRSRLPDAGSPAWNATRGSRWPRTAARVSSFPVPAQPRIYRAPPCATRCPEGRRGTPSPALQGRLQRLDRLRFFREGSLRGGDLAFPSLNFDPLGGVL